MKEHLNNILIDLDLLFKDENYKYNKFDLEKIRNVVTEFIKHLEDSEDILLIELDKVKILSDMVYDLNYNNTFSKITDHISNELYAFEFLLQEELRKKEI
ncbi:MAG: hypothetical protein PHT75_01245 [Bacilli bacterium]|nr:hypothetical protein [Bacilli bacterium]MDD3304741.1 hypothetical protein [Bacilli bacterium]MDD4053580.1 hypothetical protein [Bacilli bacterium]MDD4411079.1 hypothetical protein [Bacilli bacterium]